MQYRTFLRIDSIPVALRCSGTTVMRNCNDLLAHTGIFPAAIPPTVNSAVIDSSLRAV